MPKRKIVLRDNPACGRGFAVVVKGEELAVVDYDAYGWSGIDAMEKVVCGVARAFDIAVDDRRTR